MVITLCPEDILKEWLEQSLAGQITDLKQLRKFQSEMPEVIDVTEDFLNDWQILAQSLISYTVLSLLKWDKFYQDDDLNASSVGILDRHFWQSLELELTTQSVQIMWHYLLQHIGRIEWNRLRSGDIFFLLSVTRQSKGYLNLLPSHPLPRILFNQWERLPWALTACLFKHAKSKFHSTDLYMPWENLWDKALPLPLQPLLIQKTAEYLQSLYDHWESLIGQAGTIQENQPLIQFYSTLMERIKAIIESWQQELMGGGRRQLNHHLENSRLHTHISKSENLLNQIGSLRKRK